MNYNIEDHLLLHLFLSTILCFFSATFVYLPSLHFIILFSYMHVLVHPQIYVVFILVFPWSWQNYRGKRNLAGCNRGSNWKERYARFVRRLNSLPKSKHNHRWWGPYLVSVHLQFQLGRPIYWWFKFNILVVESASVYFFLIHMESSPRVDLEILY